MFKRAVKKTWEYYVERLRRYEAEAAEREVDEIIDLVELESRPSIWRPRGVRIFAALLNDPNHLGLSISLRRYEEGKQALRVFGERALRRYGLPAMRRALQVPVARRRDYLQAIRAWVERWHRKPSDQVAWRIVREIVTPPVPVRPVSSARQIEEGLRKRIRELEAENAELRERVLELIAVQEKTAAFHAANGIKWSFAQALAEVRAARRREKAA